MIFEKLQQIERDYGIIIVLYPENQKTNGTFDNFEDNPLITWTTCFYKVESVEDEMEEIKKTTCDTMKEAYETAIRDVELFYNKSK